MPTYKQIEQIIKKLWTPAAQRFSEYYSSCSPETRKKIDKELKKAFLNECKK